MEARSKQVHEPSNLSEWNETVIDCTQQTDGHSCGLHVMLVKYGDCNIHNLFTANNSLTTVNML